MNLREQFNPEESLLAKTERVRISGTNKRGRKKGNSLAVELEERTVCHTRDSGCPVVNSAFLHLQGGETRNRRLVFSERVAGFDSSSDKVGR
jgi:hypothetical protein